MEKDEETYVPISASGPSTGSMSTVDCHLLDQFNLLRPSNTDHSSKTSVDHEPSQAPNNGGGVLFDMFGMSQFNACGSASDRFMLTEVMPFTDHAHKPNSNLAVHVESGSVKDHHEQLDHGGFDPICFLKLPLIASDHQQQEQDFAAKSESRSKPYNTNNNNPSVEFRLSMREDDCNDVNEDDDDNETHGVEEHQNLMLSSCNTYSDTFQGGVLSNCSSGMKLPPAMVRAKRKRSKTCKNSEEVESQRMTHIVVERNRRKQMNEHLRILRSLMPGSYVQRGDQASIIGGAIEFVKELEQLLQCLESQKRRRLYSATSSISSSSNSSQQINSALIPAPHQTDQHLKYVDPNLFVDPMHEDFAEMKSPVADIEVKLVAFDAIIKILSQRRPGQLLKTIAALENLHFTILHTNITTIEHTVLYSFNVKMNIERQTTAEEIAASVQQIMFNAASTII